MSRSPTAPPRRSPPSAGRESRAARRSAARALPSGSTSCERRRGTKSPGSRGKSGGSTADSFSPSEAFRKDRADVVEIVKAGLDVQKARRYLEQHAPQLVARLDECIEQAHAEDD